MDNNYFLFYPLEIRIFVPNPKYFHYVFISLNYCHLINSELPLCQKTHPYWEVFGLIYLQKLVPILIIFTVLVTFKTGFFGTCLGFTGS